MEIPNTKNGCERFQTIQYNSLHYFSEITKPTQQTTLDDVGICKKNLNHKWELPTPTHHNAIRSVLRIIHDVLAMITLKLDLEPDKNSMEELKSLMGICKNFIEGVAQ